MAKSKNIFVCSVCGTEYPKWTGKCSACGEWNTVIEHPTSTQSSIAHLSTSSIKLPTKITEIQQVQEDRLVLPDEEINRVLGGGLVRGSIVLFAGEPGIGKSTLLLQLALNFRHLVNILYISAEESEKQVKIRSERLATNNPEVYILPETQLENILMQAEIQPYEMVVIDSIQTLYYTQLESAPGTVAQVRECTHKLMAFAKRNDVPILLISHITKEGAIAGPKTLEHMVDTVLFFEGDRHLNYRILRSVKNRFGSTSELAIYEMTTTGLQPVANPSELFISNAENLYSGIAIGTSLQGNRPILLECQALVSHSPFGNPQRSVTGIDPKRMNLLIAILEKKAGIKLNTNDIFLNIVGGLKIEDPAIDLPFAMAIASSYLDKPLPPKTVFIAELSLTGELRPVPKLEQRAIEAHKLGFQFLVTSQYAQKDEWLQNAPIQVLYFQDLQQVIRQILF